MNQENNTFDKQKERRLRSSEQTEIDLGELFFCFLTRWKVLVLAFVIGAVAAGGISYGLITPKYAATSSLYMVSADRNKVVDLTSLTAGSSIATDYEQLIRVRTIADDTIKDLHLKYDYKQLQGMIDITNVSDTRVLKITVRSENPEEAKEIANTLAYKAVNYLPKLTKTLKPTIVDEAVTPDTQDSPNNTKNAAIGALIGLVVVLAVITVRFLMDDTFKTYEDIEKEFGVLPLAVVPEGDFDKSRGAHKKKKTGRDRQNRRQGVK